MAILFPFSFNTYFPAGLLCTAGFAKANRNKEGMKLFALFPNI